MIHRRVFWPVVIGLSLLVALGGGVATYRLAVAQSAAGLDGTLIVTRRAVEAEIERFRYLPRVAGEDIRVTQALLNPADPRRVGAANRYLETVADQSGADKLYLLDASGTTIAASNWNEPGSFVGASYAFRPYYADAMAGGEGRFYAIGVTTGQPGYFLATRIGGAAQAQGIVVVKVDLQPLQTAWRAAGVPVALADADGVVFLSADPGWLYRPLQGLSAATLSRIAASRTYDGVAFSDAPLQGRDAPKLTRAMAVEPDGWTLVTATDFAPARLTGIAVASFLALATMAALLLGQTLAQRRRLIRFRLAQAELLEARVAERTRDLAHEVDVRTRAEADLRLAQDALIHSEKMAALGRMSTAIVHEISQPLAAMEATLAAAVLADRGANAGDTGPMKVRIETARGHIRRMLRTIKHLKSFGKKDKGTLSPIGIDTAIANAVDLAQHRASQIGMQIAFAREGASPVVMGGLVRLEQVMLNLLMNALDAVEDVSAPEVAVSRHVDGDTVHILVRDNGCGIAPEQMTRVHEPFFSQRGDGLGLGLSICQSILTEFGGGFQITSDPAGTRVNVQLPLVADAMVAAQ